MRAGNVLRALRTFVDRLDADRFQKIASGVQALVVAIAMLGAGVWAIYTYTSLNQHLRSKLELENLEQRNSLRGVLELRLDLSQEADETGRRFIHAQVSAENKGNKDMIIEEDTTEPLNAFLVLFDKDVEGRSHPIPKRAGSANIFGGGQDTEQNQQVLRRQTIRAGEAYRFHGVVKVDAAGLYLVTFDAPIHPEDKKRDEGARWSATNYIVIK